MNMEAVFNQFPVLRSGKLVLRKVEEQHLDELFDIYSNDRVFEYCGIIPKHNKTTVRSMIGHYERDYLKRSRIKWGIFTAEDETQLLGIIEACEFNQKVNMATIGYFLAEAHWGKGLASRAVALLTDFLFMEVEVNRIQAEVMLNNEPSKQVLRKNGYVKEGMLRQAALWSGKGVVDLEIYSMLREDYMKVLQPDHEALIL
ncbi:GNAT family protein [Paenibacillus sp. FSL K6-1096]|uniref:GNAT family N-acetyltransferase n=1 Tax=Paenibacillus sp. FSL K6-1096 TaxID=2921460 RepID=UPI0030EC6E40